MSRHHSPVLLFLLAFVVACDGATAPEGDWIVTLESERLTLLESRSAQVEGSARSTFHYTTGTERVGADALAWSSSAPGVAAVNGAGIITAEKAGEATITATYRRGIDSVLVVPDAGERGDPRQRPLGPPFGQ